ncbi:MAG: phosphodiester glycosidase family protein [Clostridia bacterium]|nr:phosphodiester glycosidase family protein [Clostridia bacterium]
MAEETNLQTETEATKKHEKGKRIAKRVLLGIGATLLSLIVLFVSTFLFLLYSPWTREFRDRYVLMTYMTSNPWLSTLFFSQETIDDIFEKNGSNQPDEMVDTSIVNPVVTPKPTPELQQTPEATLSPTQTPTAKPTPTPPKHTPVAPPVSDIPFKASNRYDEKVIYHDGSVCIVEFSGTTSWGDYTARMIQVQDPSRVTLGVTNTLGTRGQHLSSMCETNDALCGINAGGFVDEGGQGHGGTPLGTVVKDGVYNVYTEETDHTLIGFNRDNILVMGKFTEEDIAKHEIRDAMSWRYPVYLVLNGEKVEYQGYAYGYDPRSAIGQCADGTVLLLVVDGSTRRGFDGADFGMMADMMYAFGAVNAANLDGGTSATMALNGRVINRVCNPQVAYNGRWLATAWLVKNQ